MQHTDNYFRKCDIISYNGSNIFDVLLHLGCGVLIQHQVKMRGTYILDERAIEKYFLDLNDNTDVIYARIMNRPSTKQYYLVDFYIGELNINNDIIDKGIAKIWKKN